MVNINFNIGLNPTQLVAVILSAAAIQECKSPLDVLEVVSQDPRFASLDSISKVAKENIKSFGTLAYDIHYVKKFIRSEIQFSVEETENVFDLVEDFLEGKTK
jgi:hypothetical protein